MAREKKKRNGEGLMQFEKQKRYMEKKESDRKERKKMKERLLYLTKKEVRKQLSAAEIREKELLQKIQ